MKLLMITGLGSAKDLALGKKGAFYNTLEEFHKYWDRIDIICPKTKNHKLKTINYFGNVYLHISPLPLIFHPIWFLYKASQIYKEQKFNLMTVHDFPPFYNGIGAMLLSLRLKVPYILEIFHIPGFPKSANLKEFFYKIFFRLFISLDSSRAKAVRVMNKTQVPDFLVDSGVQKSKIVYIPAIYIDADIFKSMDSPKEYDLIFIGRLEENKGLDLFLEAVSKLRNQIINLKVLVVGTGSLRDHLKYRIENLKLQDNILLYGWAKDSEEIAKLLNKSKALIMASYNEGGPRVVLEAMACGVPVLATPVGVVRDLIQDQDSGRIINWDSGDIADKAKELLSSLEQQLKFKKAGLEIAKKFEKNDSIKNYADQIKLFIK